jgi:hypothetical protein
MTELRGNRSAPRRLGLLAVVLVSALGAACGDDEGGETSEALVARRAPAALVAQVPTLAADSEQAEGTFVGPTTGKGPFVAAVVQGSQTLAYVCNGDDFDDWFGGTVSAGRVRAKSAAGTVIDATRIGDTLKGTVTLGDGTRHSFTLSAAEGPNAGLYRVKGIEDRVLGWIRLGDGSLRGAVSSKTVATSGTSSGEPTVSGEGGTGATTTTSTTSVSGTRGGVYSPVFKATYNNCDDLAKETKEIKFLYGVTNLADCDAKTSCAPFAKEIRRIGAALGCIVSPF